MSDSLLIVEGPDDKHVMYSLFESYTVSQVFEVRELEGIETIVSSLPTLIKATSRLGIVIDADLDIQSRWESLRHQVKDKGFDLPETPDSDGLRIENADGDVLGIWIMPDNSIPGMLEDFLKLIVPDEDELLPLAAQFVETLPEAKGRFSEKHKSKAIIHTYLAINKDPGLRFGTAVKAKYFDASKPIASKFISWVNRVLVA